MVPGNDDKLTEAELNEAFGDEFDDTAAAALSEDGDGAGDGGGGAADTDIDDEQLAKGLDADDKKDVEAEPSGDEGAEASDGRKRDPATGKFVKAEEAKAADPAKADDAAATKPTTDEAEKKPDAAAVPSWEPVSVKSGGETVTVDEARVSRANGHHFFAVPDAQAQRFMQRLSRGAMYDRTNRELAQARREIDARKTADPVPSDEQIEANLTLELIKPHLAEFLDERSIEVLELKIENAKIKAQSDRAKFDADIAARVSETPWEEEQVDLLTDTIVDVIRRSPDLADLDPALVEEIYHTEMLPIRNSLIWKDKDQRYGNQEWIYNRLKRAVGAKAGPAASAAPAPTKTPENAPSSDATKTTAADRFNRGVNAGSTSTTSVKANRDTARPASGTRRDRSDRDDARRPQPTAAMAAEDSVRKSTRTWLNSDSLDFEED